MSSDVRQLLSGSYTLGETIGRGHYAVVKLAKHIFTQIQVAVKVIDKLKLDDVSKAQLFQEVMCMKLVQHPNVVRLYEVIDTPTKLYLILEYADGGDMFDYLIKHANGLNESLARKYFRQICRALKFCHEMNVCHRDLKPENLVFFERQGVVKLTDFGFSNRFSPGKKLLTSCGSLAYSPPEILLGDPYDAPAVDIWSLGVILFMLVTSRPPFEEANDSETIMMILDCCYKLPTSVSIECRNLIHRMIVLEPEKRATLDEIMSDSWYEQYDDDDDVDDNTIDEIDSIKNLSNDEQNIIIKQMIESNLGERDRILQAIEENQYNSITATYFFLAEKLFHERNMKQKKRFLQPTNEVFNEQIRNLPLPSTNLNFWDNSFDEESEDFPGKENLPPINITPRQSIDLSIDQPLMETDEERLIVQQRVLNTTTQAMNIILEEDEYTDTPFIDQTNLPSQTLSNSKHKNDDDEDKNSTNFSDYSMTTTGTDRSHFTHKRRQLSRSCSNSDSEDNDNTQETVRLIHRKHTRSHESDLFNQNRERSYSNIEYLSNDTSSHPSQTIVSTINDNLKGRSYSSRTNSIISTNRTQLTNANDSDVSTTNSMTFITDRTRSLSNEHRLANPSQMSIASRISIRYCTPRESTVFTKTEAPPVVRLLQQTPHHDTNEIIKTLIEHQRSQPNNQENLQSAIIIEEDICPPLISFTHMTPMKSQDNEHNHHLSQQNSMFSRLKYSLIKHQRKPSNKSKQRSCCTIL